MNVDRTVLFMMGSGRGSRPGAFALLLLLPFMAGTRAARAQGLKITQINPPGATAAVAVALNKNNQAVGNYTVSGVVEGFKWLGGARYQTIVFPRSNNFTRANGINDSGEIVGDFKKGNFFHGFTDISGKLTQYDLPGGLGKFSTSIFGINNSGDTAGAAGGGTLGVNNEGWVNIAGTVTTFYGSGTDSTFVVSINSSDVAVGQYFDSSNNTHGFMWASGTITEIVFPGATQTACEGINDSGEITGYYIDSAGIGHGFTDIAGVFATSDLPFVGGVNKTGAYVGFYFGPKAVEYGFLASAQAYKPSTVKVPKATSTSIYGVNNSNVMVGQYTDSTGVNHGLMLAGSTVTKLDDPNAFSNSTFCEGINSTNEVVCDYQDSSSMYHAATWVAGTFTDIPIPGATQTVAYGVNDAGDLSGYFVDSSNVAHGFLLKGGIGGTLTQLDVPGATQTFGISVNASDTVAVQWTDSAGSTESSLYNDSSSTYTTINLPGAEFVYVHSINKAGDVVYSWVGPDATFHGGLLSGGSYYLLDDPSGTGTRTDGINDSNLIVGRYLPTGSANFEGLKGMK